MKNLKYIILVIVSVLTSGNFLLAQSYDRINNYWNNLYTINPAAINNAHLGTVSAIARQQWLYFPGAPTTFFATGSMYFEDLYSQFGLKVMAKKKGITSYTDVDLSYAYAVTMNRSWNMNLGLALSYQTFHYDVSEISFPSYENPDIYNRMIFNDNLNVDFGIEFYNKYWKFGASSHNLVSLFKKENDCNPNINLAYLMFRQNNSDYINMGIGISAFHYSNMLQMEFNTTAYFKRTDENNPFYLGLIYRTWREIGVTAGIDLSKKFSIAYSCDYNLGQIYRHSFASHEIMLIWNFEKIYRCKNCWWYE